MTHRILRSLAAIGLIALAACDIPTSPDDFPAWDVTIRIPNQSDTTTIDEFMPEGVTIDWTDSSFVFDPSTYHGSVSSDILCDICSAMEGALGAYPTFVYSDTFKVNVGGEFDFTQLSGGEIALDLTHDLPFTLLRSEDGSTGFIVASLYTDAGLVSADTIRGTENVFAPGNKPLTIRLPLQGIRITPDTMNLVIHVESPGSGADRILSTSHILFYDAEVIGARARSVTVTRDVTEFEADEPLELKIDEEIRRELEDPISRAAVTLTITHPFAGLTGDFAISFASDSIGLNVIKTETIRFGANTTATIELVEADIRALLQGEGIFVRYNATLDGGTFAVRPADAVAYMVEMEIDVTINEKE